MIFELWGSPSGHESAAQPRIKRRQAQRASAAKARNQESGQKGKFHHEGLEEHGGNFEIRSRRFGVMPSATE
jgi:hypothetical protein